MSDYERLMARADQSDRLAREMTSREHRDQILEIAAEWRRLAERAALAEARTIPRPAPRDRG